MLFSQYNHVSTIQRPTDFIEWDTLAEDLNNDLPEILQSIFSTNINKNNQTDNLCNYDSTIYSLNETLENPTIVCNLQITSDDELKKFIPAINTFSRLTRLSITNLSNATIPPQIGKLTQLTSLNISQTQRTTLPKEIGELQNLLGLY